MASNHKQELEIYFQKVTGQLTTAAIRRATKVGAMKAVELIQQRNDEGKDISDQKFARRNPRYLKRKARLIRRYSGRFAAKSASDWMRLSGGLYRSMSFKGIKTIRHGKSVSGLFTLYIKGSKQQKQMDGLMKKRKLWPLSKLGTARRGRENRAIARAMKDALRVSTSRGVVIER